MTWAQPPQPELNPTTTGPQMDPWGLRFRKFFFRGLAFLLPTILTVWLLITVYGFFQQRIAEPINAGIRQLVIGFSSYPTANDEEVEETRNSLSDEQRLAMAGVGQDRAWLVTETRRKKLDLLWSTYAFPLDLIGLVTAVAITCVIGAIVGSFLGNRLVAQCEAFLLKIPLVKQIYPSVKQVTSFLVGSDNPQMRFRKVVAVEYPRKGMWSLGLVTGETLRTISENAAQDCVTVFVPNSPTPFTGFVIIVPRKDTIELAMRIEEALRFIVSGGVIVPASESKPDAPNVDMADSLLECSADDGGRA